MIARTGSVTSWAGRSVGSAVVAAALLVGCSDPAAEEASTEDVEVVDDSVAEEAEPSGSGPDDEPDDVIDPGPDEVDVAEGSPRPDLGLPPLTLLTPATGEGPRPVLRWEPVEGAATYAVAVYAAAGEPASWSWRGAGTSVRVGFVDDPTVGGPNVVAGMTWSVLALDGDDEPVAQSNERPLGP
jgi:hypothetical protein